MAHLIDKDALIAEIKKYKNNAEAYLKYHHNRNDKLVHSFEQEKLVMSELLSFLDTLEAKEVNLDEEIDNYVNVHFSECDDGVLLSDANSRELTLLDITPLAKYFFELGLKAKNWEKKRMEECPYRQVGCTMYEGKILECKGACSWVVDYPKLKELRAQKGE